MTKIKALILAFLCLVVFAAPAAASWVYVEYQPGWYLRTNGVENDGYIYYRSGCDRCGVVSYAQWGPITATPGYQASAPQSYKTETVTYSKNWKTDLVAALSANKDSELFLQAVRESGLQPAGGHYSAQNYGGGGYGGAYTANGVTSIAQGFSFAQQGSTVYGLAALPAGGRLDTSAATHELQRSVDGLVTGATQVNNLIAASIREANSGDAEVARILATGQAAKANAEAAATIARSVQQPKQITQQWSVEQGGNRESGVGSRETPPAEAPGASQPLATAPPQRPAMAQVRGYATFEAHCLACHSPTGKAKEHDFSTVERWPADKREALARAAYKRMTGQEKPQMPQGGEALSQQEINDVTLYLAGG